MPLASTTTLLPTSKPQSCASAMRLVSGWLSGLSGGSSSRSSLPALSRYFFSASISAGKKSIFGPAATTIEASSGTAPCCAMTTLSTV